MALEQTAIGFIGLGAMGGGIARRLAQAGMTLHVCDVDPVKIAAFSKWDVVVHTNPKSIADAVEVVFACLPDIEVSQAVAYGAEGVIHGKKLKVYIETSTIGRSPMIDIAKTLATKNISVLDCPVSGGPRGADDGTLAVLVAGDAAVIESVRGVLNLIGKSVFDIGREPGMAQMMKLVNNMISATNMASASQIDIGDEIKGFFGNLGGAAVVARNADTHVVMQDIDPTPLLFGKRDRSSQIAFFTDICFIRKDF